jgi:hypothetical protein
LKARIVPDGRGDSERNFLRTDSPTMAVDIFRFLNSIAAEQGGGGHLHRLTSKPRFFRPKTIANLWLLMAATYGLVDSGRLWYLTSSKAMRQFGLSCSSLDSCTWTLKEGNNVCLIALIQTVVARPVLR